MSDYLRPHRLYIPWNSPGLVSFPRIREPKEGSPKKLVRFRTGQGPEKGQDSVFIFLGINTKDKSLKLGQRFQL